MLSQISGAESSHNDSVIDFVLYGIPLPPLLRMFGVYIYHWSLGSPDVAKWNIGNICKKKKKLLILTVPTLEALYIDFISQYESHNTLC